MRGLRPQRGEDKERGERSTGVTVRERTLGRGETRAQARTSLSLWFLPSHSRPAPSENKHQTKDKNINTKYTFSKLDVGTADRPAPSKNNRLNERIKSKRQKYFLMCPVKINIGQRIQNKKTKNLPLAKWMSALPTAPRPVKKSI